MACGLWARKGLNVQPKFADLAKSNFGADVVPDIDFADAAGTAKRMNEWGKKRTEGMVEQIIDEKAVPAEGQMMLCNAILLKANWQHRFDEKATDREARFWLNAAETAPVPLMQRTGDYRMFGDDDAPQKVLELPFVGGDLSMVLVLPKEKDGLAALEKRMTPDAVRDWLKKLDGEQKKKTYVALPKFQVESRLNLAAALQDLGLKLPFGPEAEFPNLSSDKGLMLSQVMQEARIKVDENGVEAAAVSGIVVIPAAGRDQAFRADHPFVFLIRDNRNGNVLFLGRVVNPVQP
jgi:serpin B